MISPLLGKLYGIILEKKINEWLEIESKRAKGQAAFTRNHSTTDHLVTLRIIAEECRNNKSHLFCCFVDLWWILEKLFIHCLEITCGIG